MMTAEERAKAIVGDRGEVVKQVLLEYGVEQAKRVQDFLDDIERQITTAIREAQNAKLEEAAVYLETMDQDDEIIELSLSHAADLIRSLVTKD